MTNLAPLTAMRPSPPSWRSRGALGALGLAFALAFTARPAAAQAPASPPPPPQPAAAQAPTLRRPPTPPPPPAAAPARAASSRQAATFAPIRAPAHPGLPVDSVRPAAAAAPVQPPANAVAQCGDGTFVVAPATTSGCATHRGLLVTMPPRTTPPVPSATTAVSAPMAMQAAAPSSAPAPAGATMRCKDGTYLGGAPAQGLCDAHGGLAAVLVAPRTPPPAPARVRRP